MNSLHNLIHKGFKNSYKIWIFVIVLFLFTVIIFSGQNTTWSQSSEEIYLVTLEDTITAGNVAFVKRMVDEAEQNNAEAIIVLLNTPGGLVDATLDLCSKFIASEVPVVVYVYPAGSIAASAGAFILLSSDIAVMSPATSVGAAQPITMSPEGTESADDKTTNFLAKQIREFAEAKERPGDIAERFVTENLTLGHSEALDENVINMVSTSLDNLLEQLHGYTFEKQEQTITLNTEDTSLVEKNMSLAERVQDFVSDPQIAFLLLMGGMMMLYVGFSNPGTFVAEVIGGIVLVMGIYGIGLFDTNTTGITLILLGIALLVAEVYAADFGIMGVGGIVSLLIGSLLLPMEPLMEPDWYRGFMITVIGTVIGVSLIMLVIVQRIISSRLHGTQEKETIFNIPETGVVVEELNPWGMVRARGETWRAKSLEDITIPGGAAVQIEGNEGLVLLVRVKPENE